ncbi:MAG: hypothetical protein A2808_03865 [Candidatus Moranbacteria bacterium RIFCSPHIGHO2_01_FULL_55_24]|nr:MAG: hypothetical protein A2808_03865 [Candidatus Moranbacteria bacterium RIFCSPHIGHO2_01_FULL_55_24]
MDAITTTPPSSVSKEGFEYSALLAKAQTAMASGREIRVAPDTLRPLPDQPRKFFNQEGLLRLGNSMKTIGQLQPGIIRRVPPDGKVEYELLDGERRWRAAKMAGLAYRATLVDLDDEAVPFIIAAVANFNREGHTPTEVSDSIAHMANLTIPMEEIASLLGISPFWAYQIHGLQKLHPDVRDMLDPTLPKDKMLPVTAAIQISKVDIRLQRDLAEKVLSRTISVRNLRQEAVSASKKAGLYIREREMTREPRKQWELIKSSMQQLLRTSQDLQGLLKEGGIENALKGRSQVEIWTILNGLEEARIITLQCEGKIRKICPD